VNGNIFPEVPPNEKLRKELSKKTAPQLFSILKKLDTDRAKTIDPKNKIRLIRAIEIAKTLGKVPKITEQKKFKVLKIGLAFPQEILKERIYARLLARIKLGMIKEIKNLHEKEKVSWKKLESFGLEYRHVALFLQGKLLKEEMVEKLNSQIWHFAKRQQTWFKRDPNTIWINPSKKTDKAKAIKAVEKFLK
jgi:tRNA dimethylallyltransferase